jgi:site-specific DNA-adenine methylase
MRISGKKDKDFYDFIKEYLPSVIDIYVEPFGGSFGLGKFINANLKVYNDILDYDINIECDKKYHIDYEEIIEKYDSPNTFFYLDPPYYRKEFHYNTDFDENSHQFLYEVVKNIQGNWILSYNNERYIKNMYKDYTIKLYDGQVFSLRNDILIIK